MMKVIVADDEAKVCQLICNLVDWASLDMEVAGVAHNGIEALELVETLRPDLIITDIRMPGYDGLELISRAKAAKPDLDFIVVSGYRHFEYAQSAIKYGVSDYLLKPIKKADLIETLLRTREKYLRRTEQLTSAEQLKMTLQSDIDKLRAGLFANLLLQGGAVSPDADIARINADYHFHFAPGCFQMFVAKLDCPADALCQDGMKLLTERLEKALRDALQERCADLEICTQGCRAYGILNFPEEERKTVRKQLKNALDDLLLQQALFGGARLTIGLGAPAAEIGGIGESLASAQRAAAQRLVEGTGKLIEGGAQEAETLDRDALLAEFSKNFEAALEVLDADGAAAAIAALRTRALGAPGASGQELFRLAADACSVYLMLLRNHRLTEGDTQAFYERFTSEADLCPDAGALFDTLSRMVGESLEAVVRDRRQADRRPIRVAKQYIQQNYRSPLSLEEVSGVVGFSAAYFSSLFKKESGQNFLEYLSEVRMNKAKELLKETSLSVAAVCEQVGYNDLKHFTQSFKKFTGLKPNEFRKLYS